MREYNIKKAKHIILSTILITICLFNLNIQAETEILYGDTNADDLVDVRDTTSIQRYTGGQIKTLPEIEGKEIVDPTNPSTITEPEADPTTPTTNGSIDKEEVVNDPDTLAKIPIIISIVSITLIAVWGAITSIVVLKKQDNKKVDL